MRLRWWSGGAIVAACLVADVVPAHAQNAAPKNESDCGVTTMCSTPVAPHHDGLPLWTVELVLFALLLVAAGAAYRLLLARHRPTT
jgi:hypothetical protein